MDAKTSFFSRINANLGQEGKDVDKLPSDSTDADIDFEITESGRTTVGNYDGPSEDDDFDGMEFSISNATGRVNTDRSMNTIATIGTIDTENSIEPACQEFMDIATSTRSTSSYTEGESEEGGGQAPDKTQTTSSPEHHFQPLQPLPEHPERRRSAPRAIPKGQVSQSQQSTHGATTPSQPNSAGSSGSAFLNNILNTAASTFNNAQISHTPPTQISTSYEASHFGKRARSGVRSCNRIFIVT